MIVAPSPGWTQVAATYTVLGVEHILLGIDHLLFILALLLLVRGWGRLAATVTAFTIAHSFTLAAATLGLVHVPQRPVEAAVALSIAFVAAEIVQARRGQPGLTARSPWIAAFAFGLLHGLGFAGALSEVGLPQSAIPAALFFFNIGVEIGQLLFIAAAFAVFVTARQAARRLRAPQPSWAWRIPPYAIGSIAAFWVIQRVAVW
jgi:hydrogenase/urease accessory protein HupE